VLFFLCRKVGVGLKVDNNRYLCNKCADNYSHAGYDIKRTGTNCDDETCEICNWYRSHEYIVIDKGDIMRALLAEERNGDPTSSKLSER
jgi:hypothetical protein